ncbi:sugar ABC transporter permease [Amycolatopsis mediterranei S699]|uniref:Permease component of ABC-type sugar transport system n=1 Tax=Amycolatopsis mediterranei (strain U-32) TaxID=749927 RepID=A0A0H3DDV9_AMYMU|nr:carbohydrate ABC transporter permease [Amycolatopsis mediterranei]ADJ47809.1 permease component of ABC-type sugar transport system [Amycolatopsis mediterranei U32]AFO79520.1 sugar ABC transporter permease [Amycolatopsis mediterranei S699]AGT86648.1 sugar ABC transporter permease [Amycolatopsis mediterranei RB]KDO10386.1 sugar ABC transporter permease [Amycolatopsis mediterranei]KDU85284.1 sugar ABC transporter permease [Amycolatopsis mediterranei]
MAVKRPGRLIAEVVTVVIAGIVAFPLYWMLLSAVKPPGEIQSANPKPWTFSPSFDSFSRVLTVSGFGRYFVNSLLVALVVVALSLLLSFLSAVALTRFSFKGRTVLLVMTLVAQMVPVEALTIPLFFLMRQIGGVVPAFGLNELGSLVLVHLAFSLPFAIWMLRGFVAAVPVELEDAAALDGASRMRFTWQILFPLVAPGLVAVSVLAFIHAWNDFLFAKTFIVSKTENQTLPQAILVFFKPEDTDWGAVMASSTLMTIPVLVFFVLVQRRLVSGMAGAVKG